MNRIFAITASIMTIAFTSGCDGADNNTNVLPDNITQDLKGDVTIESWLGNINDIPDKLPPKTMGSNYVEIIYDLFKFGQKNDYETTDSWNSRLDEMPKYLESKYGNYFVFKLPIDSDLTYNADEQTFYYDNKDTNYIMLSESINSEAYRINFAILPTHCRSISFDQVNPEVARATKELSYANERGSKNNIYAVGKIDTSKNGFISPDRSTLSDMGSAGFEHVPGIKSLTFDSSSGLTQSMMLTADFKPTYYAIVNEITGEILSKKICNN